MKKTDIKPVDVFSGSLLEAEMVKSLLLNCEIAAYLKDENIGTLAPWYTGPGGYGSVKVVVSNQDFDKARIIVEDYEKKIAK